MNLSNLNQARELKAKLDKAQQELSNTVVEASVAKGAVKVTMDGQQKVKSVQISPGVMNPEKPEKLEELVAKALNEALAKSQKAAAKQLRGLTGGLKIPGLF
ncbi:MAG: YbaB/EbfC family nucleoid-associated protein [Dehalococcoidales bacterium]|jgi:DNA-binding YbaB/EbfC family protein|nr:YbaB/EbfC family nucleoid-associated protein [Dehalococcoidales bacterium]